MKMIKWIVISGIIATLIGLGIGLNNLYNKEVDMVVSFEQKKDQRKAFFDKMSKTINQVAQVPVQVDESFTKNIEIIMSGHKDAEGIMFKMVQQANPNANFGEVTSLYKNLARVIEAQREGFFQEEKIIQDVVAQHKRLLRKFPNGFILKYIFGKKELEYNPISSTRTDEVFNTGKDDDIKLFE